MADLEGEGMKNLARGAPADVVLQLKEYTEPNSRRTWVRGLAVATRRASDPRPGRSERPGRNDIMITIKAAMEQAMSPFAAVPHIEPNAS
jgi:hypothetical protein